MILLDFFQLFFPLIVSIPATGGVFGPQGESGSEPEDDSQMKFYTEQHRGRRRSKGERECRSIPFHTVVNVLHIKHIK